jgi:hypothetical protein
MKQKGADNSGTTGNQSGHCLCAIGVARRTICDIILIIRENEGICSQRNASG